MTSENAKNAQIEWLVFVILPGLRGPGCRYNNNTGLQGNRLPPPSFLILTLCQKSARMGHEVLTLPFNKVNDLSMSPGTPPMVAAV